MKRQDDSAGHPLEKSRSQSQVRPQYEAPRVTKMSEKDVLKSFQVTSAAASWWGT
jgi:hypothetical protein